MVRGDFSRSKFRDVSRAKLHMGQLMNVLMHLRKVCNHPSLFENEPAVSPFACSTAAALANADLASASLLATRGESVLSRSLPAFAAAVALDVWATLDDELAELEFSPPVVSRGSPLEFVNAPAVAADHVATTTRSSAALLRFGQNLPLRERLCAPRGAALLGPQALWRPDVTARRSSAVHSCLRVAGVSSGEAWFHSVAPLLDRWLMLRNCADEDDCVPLRAPHLRAPVYVAADRTLPAATATRSLALELLDSARGVIDIASGYCARAVASPADIAFVDSSDSHVRAVRTRMLSGEALTGRVLHGLPYKPALAAASELHSDALCAEVGGAVWRTPPMQAVGGLWRSTTGAKVHPLSFEDAILASGKLTALDRLLTQLKREGHRVLLYSQMTKMLDVLEDLMAHRRHRYVRLDGSSRLEDRRDLVNDWQSNDELFVFLLSTRAGGIGINLTAADTVVFYDGDWNPTMDEQAMDRTHRLGQTKQVTVYRLLAAGTIEERIMRRARQKQRIHSLVIKGSDLSSGNLGADAAQITSVYGGTDAIADAGPDELDTNEVLSLLLDDDEQNIASSAQRVTKRARAAAAAASAATTSAVVEKKPKIEVLPGPTDMAVD
jgi:SNF2 family DNA or RNA helicase